MSEIFHRNILISAIVGDLLVSFICAEGSSLVSGDSAAADHQRLQPFALLLTICLFYFEVYDEICWFIFLLIYISIFCLDVHFVRLKGSFN